MLEQINHVINGFRITGKKKRGWKPVAHSFFQELIIKQWPTLTNTLCALQQERKATEGIPGRTAPHKQTAIRGGLRQHLIAIWAGTSWISDNFANFPKKNCSQQKLTKHQNTKYPASNSNPRTQRNPKLAPMPRNSNFQAEKKCG